MKKCIQQNTQRPVSDFHLQSHKCKCIVNVLRPRITAAFLWATARGRCPSFNNGLHQTTARGYRRQVNSGGGSGVFRPKEAKKQKRGDEKELKTIQKSEEDGG